MPVSLARVFVLPLLVSMPLSHTPAPKAEATAPLTFFQDGNRFLAVVDRGLFERDFVLHAKVAAVSRAPGAGRGASVEPVPAVGTPFASGALRLRQVGDSVVVSEYAGWAGRHLQYRRRAGMPVLRVTPAGAVIVDATPLWTAVGPRAADEKSRAYTFDLLPSDAGRAPSIVAELPGVATVVRPLGGNIVRYQVGILRLPAEPMRPRLYDRRTNHYSVSTENGVAYVQRWRVEKKNPGAAVSDVVEPIRFRIAPSVPPQWVPYFKQAVEQWLPVFEAAGFRNAVVVRTAAETPPAEATEHANGREAVMRWLEGGALALGGGIPDPRTGEITSGTATLYSDMVRQSRGLYFAMAGGVDPRARVPFPDSLTGSLIVAIMTHEVGHVLGFDHNFRGGTSYPTDSLRHATFLRRMGHAPSIMAYSFVNYVAQPEDRVPFENLVGHPGAYDYWALGWSYRPIPEAATTEAERPVLEQWRAAQDTAAYLRTHTGDRWDRLDPFVGHYILGDDLAKSSEYGIRNLAVLAARLDPRTDTAKIFSLTPHGSVARQWQRLLSLSLTMVGGMTPKAPYPADYDSLELEPIDSARQVSALRSAIAHSFLGQSDLLRKYVLASAPKGPSPALVLFDTVAAGWSTEEWQSLQQSLMHRLTDTSLVTLAEQSSPVLPVLCQELKGLGKALAVAAEDRSVPVRQRQAVVLRDAVTSAIGQGSGHCS